MLLQAELVPALKEKVKKSEEKLLEAKKQIALDERLRKANQAEMDKKTIEVRELEKKLILANTEKATTFFKQSEEIKTLKKRNREQETQIEALKKCNRDQEVQIDGFKKRVKTQSEEVKTLFKHGREQETEIGNLQKQTKTQSENIKQLRREQTKEAKKDNASRALVLAKDNVRMINMLYKHMFDKEHMTLQMKEVVEATILRNYTL